jgi:hypothetical protein
MFKTINYSNGVLAIAIIAVRKLGTVSWSMFPLYDKNI